MLLQHCCASVTALQSLLTGLTVYLLRRTRSLQVAELVAHCCRHVRGTQIEFTVIGQTYRRLTCWHASWRMCSGWQLQPGALGACCAFLLLRQLCPPRKWGHNGRALVCQSVRLKLGYCCGKQDWLQHMGCQDAVGSVDKQRMVAVE